MTLSKTLWTIGSLIGAQQALKAARGLELDDVLGLLGMARRRSNANLILPALGLLSLGAIVGAGTALLVAPSTGKDMRQRLSAGVEKLADKLNEQQNNQASHLTQQQA